MQALPELKGHGGPVLVLSGDVPLLERASVAALFKAFARAGGGIAFIEFEPADPTGYGRVIRDEKGAAIAIREDRDCSRAEKRIREVNSGIYAIDAAFLRRGVKKLSADNEQGELYLTDLVALAAKGKGTAVVAAPPDEVCGVNDRVDLARVEAIVLARRTLALMRDGVTIRRPGTVQVDLDVRVGTDVELGAGVELRGATEIGDGCRIGTGSVIVDSKIAAGAAIHAYSVLEGATVGPGAVVGPFARLRPGAQLGPEVHIGNFVEVKNSTLAAGAKANHLAYLGDATVGERVNYGAGSITANYDGANKHRTVIEDDVHVGSNCVLVAPVTLGAGGTVAGGSTITKDTPPGALTVARGKQVSIPNWKRPQKAPKG
jgi:bifunctional UDP-N-acetylglucosamine pyrophosphorylase/glucosamine-1-phosphate N-acetyltransferase